MVERSIHYLPGLNGLRAIGALLIVVAHTSLSNESFGLPSFPINVIGFRTNIFFTISGFLITYLLIRELDTTGNINIRKFYMRRVLRLWPLYYLFLIVSIAVFVFLDKENEILSYKIWFYVFFLANIPFSFGQAIPILAHCWTIAVEEQFYLFWPWIMRFSVNKILIVSVLIIIVLSLIKIAFWFFLGTKSHAYLFMSVARFSCLIIGAIGAIIFTSKQKKIIVLLSNKLVQILGFLVFILMSFDLIYVPTIFSHEVISIISLGMIMGQVNLEKRIVNLENKIFNFIGKISYGIFVIHPLVILLLSRFFINFPISIGIKYVIVYSSVLLLTILAAWLSYEYFEKYFLIFKSKFSPVKASNHEVFFNKQKVLE